jgi:hypothetical protein
MHTSNTSNTGKNEQHSVVSWLFMQFNTIKYLFFLNKKIQTFEMRHLNRN